MVFEKLLNSTDIVYWYNKEVVLAQTARNIHFLGVVGWGKVNAYSSIGIMYRYVPVYSTPEKKAFEPIQRA